MELSSVPKLEGWLTFAEAGERLGVTRQAVFGMVGRNELTKVRSIGGPKPIHLVHESDVDALVGKRADAKKDRADKKAAQDMVPQPVFSDGDETRKTGQHTVVDVV